MTPRQKHWLKFSFRWGVAVLGIGWVLWGITFRDRTTVLAPTTNLPEYVQVLDDAREDQVHYRIARTVNGAKSVEEVTRDKLWVRPDRKSVDLKTDDPKNPDHRTLLAVKPTGGRAREVVVKN